MKHITAAVLIAFSLDIVANAEVVLFNNTSGQFTWVASIGFDAGSLFDPTIGASQQAGASPIRSMAYQAAPEMGSNSVFGDFLSPRASIRIARAPDPVFVSPPLGGVPVQFDVPVLFGPAQVVGSASNYQGGVAMGYFNPILGRHSLVGEHPIVGFRVMLDDGLPRFGYIEFERRVGPLAGGFGDVLMFQPVRWAYETEPNTPITVVPAPGVAAGFVLGAAAIGARRRRTSQG